MKEFVDLIGTPFEKMDCFALVRECYKRLGFTVPKPKSSAEQSKRVFREFLQEISTRWKRVEKRPFVCVAIRYDTIHPKAVTHFGFLLEDDLVLHTTITTGAIIQPLASFGNLVEGFYEFKHD